MRQFVESMKRLYESGMIKKDKVISVFNDRKITQEEMEYILTYEHSK